MKSYQHDYASERHQMYDFTSRAKRARRIIKTLSNYLKGSKKLKELKLLNVGSSTGIMDYILAPHFKEVVGIDIDKKAVFFAKTNFKLKNLHFSIGDAMNLRFKNETFDVAICAQVYEHVPDPKRLFSEIHRVLKEGGICYLAALNKLWPLEPHYNLLFLSWLPKPFANIYMNIMGKGDKYYETLETYWKLKDLTRNFITIDYTQKILKDPKKFGYPKIPKFVSATSSLLKYFTPTFFWILVKKQN